jgi:hypothetical protein
MPSKTNSSQTYIWTPLIGFDKNQSDKGVKEYYSNLSFKPDAISLFVFCPDIVHHHDGMEAERILPPDNCNYYGNVRNEIRDIQPWTNHDLRELVLGLNNHHAETYIGLMGVFVDRDPDSPEPYNIGHREWLFDHPELVGVYRNANFSLNVLKRFGDGSWYEDFFLEKVRKALRDYGFSGLHVADNFCPPGTSGTAQNGDFSDDMTEQFVSHTSLQLPDEIIAPVKRNDRVGIQKRGNYIWQNHKQAWLEFLTWRWAAFWKKICDGLHEDGKKVIVNNAWCSEPFEAIYRYGVDYKKLYAAGVDCIAAETVPTSVHSCGHDPNDPYRLYNFMTMPSFMKAFTPTGKVLCLNGVKDSTEEWSVITHLPSHVEREVYSLTNYFLQTENGLTRTMDGFLVCLGDGLTKDEWSWLRERHETGFAEIPEKVLSPTMIWSDQMVYDFLPDYIETKRWSAHQTIVEFAKRGGQIGAISPIENLANVSGPIFIPNIDLLKTEEIAMIAAYNRGAILCTSLVDRNFKMPGSEADLYFEDPQADCKMCIWGFHLGDFDYENITATLGEDDGSNDVEGDPREADEDLHFRKNLVYRKVSTGFIQACAKLIRACYDCELTTEIENPFLPLRMKDGRIRLLLGNDNRVQYLLSSIKSKRAIKSAVSKSTFPALPAKMLDAEGRIIIPKADGSHRSITPFGCIAKIPPGGLTILDVELEEQ